MSSVAGIVPDQAGRLYLTPFPFPWTQQHLGNVGNNLGWDKVWEAQGEFALTGYFSDNILGVYE